MDSSAADFYRVLIVDDDPTQSEMVAEFLRVSGSFKVGRAGDIAGLWAQLASNPYDIVLLDYRLPDGTGLEALEVLTGRGYSIPVVMVTAQGDERVAVQAIQRGATDYLLKNPDYLLTLPTLIHKAVRAYRLQQSVERSLEQVRYQATLLNNVRDAIVVWDVEGKITYWNPAAMLLFGPTARERLGCPVAEVYLNAFSPPVAVPRPGDTVGRHVERQCQTRRNGTIWVSSRITALYDAEDGNRPIGHMDVSHDITPRKQAEQALRTERNFVSAVLDTVAALVVVTDRSGRIVRFNRTCEATTGYSFTEVRGKHVWELFLPPEEVEPVQRMFARILDGEYPTEEENAWITRSGDRRWIAWSNTALTDRQGRVEYVIATGLDLTERRKAQEQVIAAQTHLAQATRLATIGEMASGVAHQINNPLTTIIADAQILLRQMPPEDERRDSIEAIEKAGWRLQEVVQRLVEFSRPATATLGRVAVNESIERALLLVGAHIEAVGIALEHSLADGLPEVRGNARQLEDLWVNLLLLARDAAAGDGPQTIRVRSAAGPGGQVVVEVADNGLPIPTDQLDAIFEPNFIGPTSGRGTGLELSICREIVRQHGGEVVAESRGCETILRVSLPAGGA